MADFVVLPAEGLLRFGAAFGYGLTSEPAVAEDKFVAIAWITFLALDRLTRPAESR